MHSSYKNQKLYFESLSVLKEYYGQGATFRAGQYEAIEATMTQKRTLIVQATGWGKSLVYFICTKLNRRNGKGITMVISPLVALMDNQMSAANKLDLQCDILNSRSKERRASILEKLKNNELDLVLITPETLFSSDVQSILSEVKISLFVIDEAHCISDWGHDFRLEYGRLIEVIKRLPDSVSVLATTATANTRVVNDLKQQLGENVFVSRGSLSRQSLRIQVLNLPNKIERYAWILDHINDLPGSGIIYCLTKRDCENLSNFLQANHISAMPYYANKNETLNIEIEHAFLNNHIKVLVATTKLGMGYDKGDISFIIHFQAPTNIVSYYQQIGRAGRNIPVAYTFLMFGKEDVEIAQHFIKTAFPTEREMQMVRTYLLSQPGASSLNDIEEALNFPHKKIEHTLQFLIHHGYVIKDKKMYFPTAKPFTYDQEEYEEIKKIRIQEMQQMQELARTTQCYQQFICVALDDYQEKECGHCANCNGVFEQTRASEASIRIAEEYLNGLFVPIEPRLKNGNFKIPIPNQQGISLSKYGDPGYGELVKKGKYGKTERFDEKLVIQSAKVLKPLIEEQEIFFLTCVPSLRSNIVSDFAQRLASRLGITFVVLLEKREGSQQQKNMENSNHQRKNAFDYFTLKEGAIIPLKVLLVDDLVDSRWTFTACGHYLTQAGCLEVYPFALADSSKELES